MSHAYLGIKAYFFYLWKVIMKERIFVFPGQGSQKLGMGKDISEAYPIAKAVFEEASESLGMDMQKLIFDDPDNQLNLTEFTQPALLTVSTAIWRILEKELGETLTLVAGHSLGEYSALTALGAMTFQSAVKAVNYRGQAMQRAVPVGVGAMAAYIGEHTEKLRDFCQEISQTKDVVEVVNYNCRSQVVISGHKDSVNDVIERIKSQNLGRVVPLPVSAPFHSSLMKKASEDMDKYLETMDFSSFTGQICANIDANFYDSNSYTKDILVKQLSSPVLWTQTMEAITKRNPDGLWVEVGPGRVLKSLLRKDAPKTLCYETSTLDALEATLNELSK